MTILSQETFSDQITEALKQYDRTVVCLEKTPDSFECTVQSLVKKAILAYGQRKSDQRQAIALDRHVTVIITQTEDNPVCGIYLNLSSPYKKLIKKGLVV